MGSFWLNDVDWGKYKRAEREASSAKGLSENDLRAAFLWGKTHGDMSKIRNTDFLKEIDIFGNKLDKHIEHYRKVKAPEAAATVKGIMMDYIEKNQHLAIFYESWKARKQAEADAGQ